MSQDKKVMVSGCFDMLHSGHIAFLNSAAAYGKLYVCLGSDQTIQTLKKRETVNNELERKYHLEALKAVHEVHIGSGSGYLDFLPELERIQPDVFVVNEDGFSEDKAALCREKGIELIVLPREPFTGLPARSTTDLRSQNHIPYRIDLAGGWLDQPFVSLHAAGPVITLCLEPNQNFDHRSGMATSTRKVATQLWHTRIPKENDEQVAKMLFAFENPPGKAEVAGSQDSIGIVYTGLTKSYYAAQYWPQNIENTQDEDLLQLLEKHLFLLPLGSRKDGYNVLENTRIQKGAALALSEAAEACWKALLQHDLKAAGAAMTAAFIAQVYMFPHMMDEVITQKIEAHKSQVWGYKLSGAGGGGYLVLLAANKPEGALNINIRRKGTDL